VYGRTHGNELIGLSLIVGQTPTVTNLPPWVIRHAGPKDLDAAISLSVSEGILPGLPVSKLEQETWRRMMTSPDLTIYLAAVGKEVIGTTTTMTMPNITYDCAPTLFIEAVRAAQAYRRQGIASAMIKQALVDARVLGATKSNCCLTSAMPTTAHIGSTTNSDSRLRRKVSGCTCEKHQYLSQGLPRVSASTPNVPSGSGRSQGPYWSRPLANDGSAPL
jgi:hypothetical protein